MTNTDKIAACNICLLADAMKDCKRCAFCPANLKLTADEKKQVQRIELLKNVTIVTDTH